MDKAERVNDNLVGLLEAAVLLQGCSRVCVQERHQSHMDLFLDCRDFFRVSLSEKRNNLRNEFRKRPFANVFVSQLCVVAAEQERTRCL